MSKYMQYGVKHIDIENKEPRELHKCYKCEWGRWTGCKYFCMMPRCVKRKAGGDDGKADT